MTTRMRRPTTTSRLDDDDDADLDQVGSDSFDAGDIDV